MINLKKSVLILNTYAFFLLCGKIIDLVWLDSCISEPFDFDLILIQKNMNFK